MASGPARDVDLQLARGRPTLPAERFLTTAEALGEDVFAELAQLEDQVRQLDLLVADADLTIKYLKKLSAVEYRAYLNYLSKHPAGNWAIAPTVDEGYYCVDDVPRDVRDVDEAIAYPVVHAQLLGWWLAHAWRFTDLAGSAIKSLDSWNVTTAAVVSRALIEEVSCMLYEADEISKRWSEAKSLPDDRADTVRELLIEKLIEFVYGAKGIGIGLPPVKNVLTYIQKFAKRYGDWEKRLDAMYAILSNAAHPAIGAKMAYSSFASEHETGAYELRLLSRRPPAAAHSTDFGAEIAEEAALATILFGGEGRRLLYQALSVVDDFGLTTRSGLLTLHPYWRKLMPGRRSSDSCSCGCGKWRAAKHRWGQPAPEIRLSP